MCGCRELVPTADINLVDSLMKLLYCLLDEWRAADAAQATVCFHGHACWVLPDHQPD